MVKRYYFQDSKTQFFNLLSLIFGEGQPQHASPEGRWSGWTSTLALRPIVGAFGKLEQAGQVLERDRHREREGDARYSYMYVIENKHR